MMLGTASIRAFAIIVLALCASSIAAVLPQTSFDPAEPILISLLVPLPSSGFNLPVLVPSSIASSTIEAISAPLTMLATKPSSTFSLPIDTATLPLVASSIGGSTDVAMTSLMSSSIISTSSTATLQAVDVVTPPSATVSTTDVPSLHALISKFGSAVNLTGTNATATVATNSLKKLCGACSTVAYSIGQITDRPLMTVLAQPSYSMQESTDSPESYTWPSTILSFSSTLLTTTATPAQNTSYVIETKTVQVTVTVDYTIIPTSSFRPTPI